MIDISLCIPTMRRWDFLKINIPNYLSNSFISEIVIVDETGEDYALLKEHYGSEPKIKLFKNESQLGPFLNKLECIKKATFDWVCLIDSDNYADEEYFLAFLSCVNNKPSSNIIYNPSFAKPRFDLRPFGGKIITKDNIRDFFNGRSATLVTIVLNTGNFIVNKSAYDILINLICADTDVKKTTETVLTSDVMYMNYLLLKNGFQILIVPDMHYEHTCHLNSLCTQFEGVYANLDNQIFSKISNL